jgi:hypothetical protein
MLRRVFAIDVLSSPGCGGRRRILAAIHPPEATEALLACLGLPVRAPPIAAARREETEVTQEWQDSVEPTPPDDVAVAMAARKGVSGHGEEKDRPAGA